MRSSISDQSRARLPVDAADRLRVAREAERARPSRMRAGREGDGRVGDALVLEQQHPGAARVGARDHVQRGLGGARAVCATGSACSTLMPGVSTAYSSGVV